MNPKVDFFFEDGGQFQHELQQLRVTVMACGLTEELKWGCPCYTFQDANIVLIHAFKEYCALLFFKGALLQDRGGLLVQQSKNVQAARQMRFTSVKEISKLKTTIKEIIFEAIEVEKAGLKVERKETADYNVPAEFQQAMKQNKHLKIAFEKLTPGRQRGYLLHFAAPKQAKTREARIEKLIPKILAGKGLLDK